MATAWAPQQYILAHQATGWSLTHCGHGGVYEAHARGVPIPVEEALDSLSGSDIPEYVYLSLHTFVTSFGLMRAPLDDIPVHSMLVDAVPISSSSSPSFVMAHMEQVFGFTEDHPKTVLRSINPQTLALDWCTLIDQQTKWLRYSAATGAVVAYGWMGVERDTGVIMLDATTGTVLRAEPIGKPKEKCGTGWGVHCDLTPAGDRAGTRGKNSPVPNGMPAPWIERAPALLSARRMSCIEKADESRLGITESAWMLGRTRAGQCGGCRDAGGTTATSLIGSIKLLDKFEFRQREVRHHVAVPRQIVPETLQL
ncbi:hypothetical protein DFH09DRAFT_1414829 [Mycena vulgaris]|nr:hypothetical protein DFH09DRAFT_1414829 [Mycena vulgaris]